MKSFVEFVNENKEMKPKLSPADEKFIAKYLSDKLDFNTDSVYRSNKFTGEKAELDPICATVYDFVLKISNFMWNEMGGDKNENERKLKKIHPELKVTNFVSVFDRSRMIFRKLDHKGYMTLLD